jgi:hypothetical protein
LTASHVPPDVHVADAERRHPRHDPNSLQHCAIIEAVDLTQFASITFCRISQNEDPGSPRSVR